MGGEARARRQSVPDRLGDYLIGDELGRGSMSVVYRATRDGVAYALKLMHASVAASALDLSLQFRREAAAVARLRHDSLVRVVEAGTDAGRTYLVMELAEGQGLDRWLMRASLDDAQVVEVGRAIAGALAEVHRGGLVHRDVKPANIVLAETGSVTLIDFGMVTDDQETDEVAGTPHYAPPEQLGMLNRAIAPPADLYALGATLYECLTGEPPFQADSHADLLHRIASEPAPDLMRLRPHTRPALAAIVARLLRKDPDDRYQSASGLLADLEDLDRLDAEIRQGRTAPLRTHEGPGVTAVETPLIGRKQALTDLSAAWRRARRGQLTFVKILGEGGSGKTRLAQQVLGKALDDGARLLVGKCQENESTPFGPIREAIERHLVDVRRMPDAEKKEATAVLREAAGQNGSLLKRLSGGLAEVLGDVGEHSSVDSGAEQQRYYQAVAEFIGHLAASDKPLVLVLDDVQWIDAGSVEVLAALASSREACPVLVIATSRPTTDPIGARYDAAVQSRAVEPIALGPLTRDEVGELVSARLGGRPLESAITDQLAQMTRGNPFAVGEYLRALLDRGVVRPTGDGWVTDAAGINSVELPEDVVDLVIGRLHELDADTASLAQLAAVSGGRFAASLLAAVSGRPLGAVQRALTRLVQAGLIGRGFDGTWSFHHDRAREAVIEGVPEARRRDLHQAIAEALDVDADPTPAVRYAIARHYAAGHAEQGPARVATANLEAGLTALAEHAYDHAFSLLDTAHVYADKAGLLDELSARLLPALGRSCAMSGRLDRAYQHLHEALAYANSVDDRFRIHHLLTLTYASQGRNVEALAALHRSFEVLGRPFPKSAIMQVAHLLGYWTLAVVLRGLGIGHGTAEGAARDRRRTLSQLNYAGTMIAMFEGNVFLMAQFVIRDFYNVHFLGASAETAMAITVYGAVLATLGLRSKMKRFTSMGVAMAEQLGDRAALAVCLSYQAVGVKWGGELDRGIELQVKALPQLEAHVPGAWYSAMMITEQAYHFQLAGRIREARDHVRRYSAEMARTNNLMFRYNTSSVAATMNMVLGDVQTAQVQWDATEAQWPPLSRTNYVQLAKSCALLEIHGDRREVGPAVQEAIDIYAPVQGNDYYSNVWRVLLGYVHLSAVQHGPQASRSSARKALRRAILGLQLRALVPTFKVHPVIWRAALARLDGRWARAERLLRRAERLADGMHNPRARFHIAVERAWLAQDRGEAVARFHAENALEIATAHAWKNKILQVRQDFDLPEVSTGADSSQTRAGTQALPRELDQAKRYADALLQVSLASASTLDGDEQARQALHAVSKVLGAERALFFRCDDGELVLQASTVEDAESISLSVVRHVARTQEPVVYTGDANGSAVDGTKSILTHGLRSIMAAPLMFQERLIGVVYLDSRLVRGIFTDSDVDVLLGVCNHIAIAVETARAARIEAERSVLHKDMELVGAVQSLMLPGSPRLQTEAVHAIGFYQSATQCGGDWWWSESFEDGSVLLWIGDVSGHGAAPAMVTSSVAGAFHALRRLQPDAAPSEVLTQLHAQVSSFDGRFHMTMTAVRIDGPTGRLELWNAGGPPAFLLRDGQVEAISTPGSVLGHGGELCVGRAVSQLRPGDRVLLCTDGVLELKADTGRDLGARGLARLLRRLADGSFADMPATLAQALNERLGEREQDDDITFVLAEHAPSSTATLDRND